MRDDEETTPIAGLGAPVVITEKLLNGKEFINAFSNLQQFLNGKRNVTSVMSFEIGGFNAIIPLITGALLNLPVIDVDGMGRAFPRVEMTSLYINGCQATPSVLTDPQDNCFLVCSVTNNTPIGLEKIMRLIATNYGMLMACAFNPFTKQELQQFGVKNSLSRAWRIGKAILEARKFKRDPMIEMSRLENARKIFKGKVVEVKHENKGAFVIGYTKIQGLDEYKDQYLQVDFQNENLRASLITEDNKI